MSFHVDTYPYRDMSYVRWANQDAGFDFFERDTMRFFDSRVVSALYAGRFFITSERGSSNVTKYTVRQAFPSGRVGTVGEFGEHGTLGDARDKARELAKRVRQTAKRLA